nr:transposase [Flavobacterium limicola]
MAETWAVFTKKPFGSPMSVAEYLGKYTHKIAISTARIKSIDNENVTFDDKDYRVAGIKKKITLAHRDCIRRCSIHILPKRLIKIRHDGFWSSTWKRAKLQLLQEKL